MINEFHIFIIFFLRKNVYEFHNSINKINKYLFFIIDDTSIYK